MTKRLILTLLAALLSVGAVADARAQLGGPRELRKLNAQPGDMISFSSSMDFTEALDVFNDLAQRRFGKIIVDPTNTTGPIGVDVVNMHWLDAFERILRTKGLWYEERENHILLTRGEGGPAEEKQKNVAEELFRSREVEISAVFFEANLNRIRQLGSSWIFTDSDGLSTTSMTAADARTGLLEFNYSDNLDFGTLSATFKALENDDIGEILASPSITVQTGREGRIQIGSDFTVTTQDFAGNTVTNFFSTGSIIRVTPTVMTVDSVNFVQLELEAERSNATSGDLGLEVRKTTAKTAVLLLDGEETVIGGLFTSEDNTTREGVPILKDLPWWVFGLRYIFGYESHSDIRTELVILLQARILPTLTERMEQQARDQARDILRERLERYDDAVDDLKRQAQPEVPEQPLQP